MQTQFTRFHTLRLRLENHVPSSPARALLWEFALFVFKQAWACLFGGTLLAIVLLTRWQWPHHSPLARYDALFLIALLLQLLLLALRLETLREAKVILLFHVVGTLMELFKTSVGSWTYPEPSFFHIGHVPLFSGFMYASVGSYLARVARIIDMRYTRCPSRWITLTLAALIYLNFFTNHYLPDMRWLLFGLVGFIFGPTWVYFRPYQHYRRIPLVAGFGLVALFIWAAENISTFAVIWVYPSQRNGWHAVPYNKYGSWFLLMIISFILVSLAHIPRLPPPEALPQSQAATPSELVVR